MASAANALLRLLSMYVMNKIVIIVQARMGSKRLPGKTMKKICGKPLLVHLIERLKQVDKANDIVIATTNSKEDEVIEQTAKNMQIGVVRGSSDNVLSRYVLSANQFCANTIVRITADCPLVDPHIIDRCIELFINSNNDLLFATQSCGFPRGLDTEVFNMDALLSVFLKAKSKKAKEHVTWYMYKYTQNYKIKGLKATGNYIRPSWRLCVDTIEDFILIRTIYENLYNNTPIPITKIINFLDKNPHIAKINAHIQQKI